MKEKTLLIGFGLLIALALNLAAYPLWLKLAQSINQPSLPSGAHFQDLNDLRRAMLERDERDLKADRSVSLRSLVQPHESDRIIYDIIPNQQVKFQGVPVQINSCGMRNAEFNIVKSPNTVRIALLGDSFAFGWGVEQDQTFAAVLEGELNRAAREDLNFEVLNFGIPGYSTFQELALYEDRVLELDPDIVLVYFVENDFGLPFFIGDSTRQGEIVDVASAKEHTFNGIDLNVNRSLLRLSELTRQRGAQLYLVLNPGKGLRKTLHALAPIRRRSGIKKIKLMKDIKQIIKERNISLKDLTLPTDPHPSALKHRLIGELLAQKLAQDFFK